MGRYRRENEFTNTKCVECNIDIWCREGVFTIYHGKKQYNNQLGDKARVESIHHMNKGIMCVSCFEESEEQELRTGKGGHHGPLD